jgi:hypothetical protein
LCVICYDLLYLISVYVWDQRTGAAASKEKVRCTPGNLAEVDCVAASVLLQKATVTAINKLQISGPKHAQTHRHTRESARAHTHTYTRAHARTSMLESAHFISNYTLHQCMQGEFSRRVKGACKWKDKNACRYTRPRSVGDTLDRETSTDTMKLMSVWN